MNSINLKRKMSKMDICLIILGFCLFFLTACTAEDFQIAENYNTPNEAQTTNEDPCTTWVATLIPKNIVLKEAGSGFKFSGDYPPAWKDGMPISYHVPEIIFQKGASAGQNANNYYFYSDSYTHFQDPSADEAMFEYKKQAIDENGNILGDNKFSLKSVLQIIPDSKDEINIGMYHVINYRFKIIDYEIISCNLVKAQPIIEASSTNSQIIESKIPNEPPIETKVAQGGIKFADCNSKCSQDCKLKGAALQSANYVDGNCQCICQESKCSQQTCINYCQSKGKGYSNSYSDPTGGFYCTCEGMNMIDISPIC